MRGVMLTLALMFAPAALAQEPAPSMEALVAQIAIDALPQTSSGANSYQWDALAARMSQVNWHFAAPYETHEAGHFILRGYIAASGEQADVVACGIETQAMAFALQLDSYSFENEDWASLVLEALRAAGADVRARTALLYDITAPGRDDQLKLRIAEECTSPMSAAAQRCWTNFVFVLPSLSTEKLGGEEARNCSASRRYYSRPSR